MAEAGAPQQPKTSLAVVRSKDDVAARTFFTNPVGDFDFGAAERALFEASPFAAMLDANEVSCNLTYLLYG